LVLGFTADVEDGADQKPWSTDFTDSHRLKWAWASVCSPFLAWLLKLPGGFDATCIDSPVNNSTQVRWPPHRIKIPMFVGPFEQGKSQVVHGHVHIQQHILFFGNTNHAVLGAPHILRIRDLMGMQGVKKKARLKDAQIRFLKGLAREDEGQIRVKARRTAPWPRPDARGRDSDWLGGPGSRAPEEVHLPE